MDLYNKFKLYPIYGLYPLSLTILTVASSTARRKVRCTPPTHVNSHNPNHRRHSPPPVPIRQHNRPPFSPPFPLHCTRTALPPRSYVRVCAGVGKVSDVTGTIGDGFVGDFGVVEGGEGERGGLGGGGCY